MTSDNIYFINHGDNTIHRYDLNGQSGEGGPIMKVSVDKPEALTVHEDAIYISADGKIISVSKSGKNNISKVMRDKTPDVNALRLYDSSTRKQGRCQFVFT